MNDRGLSLTPADMLKGYLLANITDADERIARRARSGRSASARSRSSARTRTPTASSRGCAASTPRAFASASAVPRRRTSTSSAPSSTAGCATTKTASASTKSADFARFIERDFAFYGRWYERLRQAADTLTPGSSASTSTPSTTSRSSTPCCSRRCASDDDEETIAAQAPGRRGVPRHPDPSPHLELARHRLLDDAVRDVPRHARHPRQEPPRTWRSCCASASTPRRRPSPTNDRFRLHGMNGRQIHRLLARMTDYVETRSGHAVALRRVRQARRQGRLRDRAHLGRPPRAPRRTSSRTRATSPSTAIASAICSCCPRASTRATAICRTRRSCEHYDSQNLLARSLHEHAYDHNPGFLRFREQTGLPSTRTRSSVRPTSTRARSCTGAWPSRSGTRPAGAGSQRG